MTKDCFGRVFLALALSLMSNAANAALPEAQTLSHSVTSFLTLKNVELRSGVTVDLSATVLRNLKDPYCTGKTIFAVHAILHTAEIFRPLVEELFSEAKPRLVCRAVLIDLPGHGKSGLPRGISYGDLKLNDYTTAIIAMLDHLKTRHMAPELIIGRSFGGLLVSMVQQRLLNQHTSLRNQYGTRASLFITPDLSKESPWAFADSGYATQVVASLTVNDPVRGTVFKVTPDIWRTFWLGDHTGTIIPGAPTSEQVVSLGYINDEASRAVNELVRTPGYDAPSVAAGVFDRHHGTLLAVAAYSEDIFASPSEQQANYLHLTGDTTYHHFALVTLPNAVRDLDIVDPALVLTKIREGLAE